jgi:hypothetical protein
MGLGIAILANSRPYEGMILSSITGAILLWRMVRFPLAARRPRPIRTILLPLCIVLAATLAAIGLYNHRVTGSAFQLPYQLHEATYAVTPLFIWQPPRPVPHFRHDVLRDFHAHLELAAYRGPSFSVRSWLFSTLSKYSSLLTLYVPTSFLYLLLPILALSIPRALKTDRRMRMSVLILVGFILGTLPQIFMSYRYAAPVTGLLFLVVLQSMRHLRVWTWHARPIGRSLVRVCLLTCVLAFVVTNVRFLMETADGSILSRWAENRAAILSYLKQEPGRHLVIVRYGHRHSPQHEWVFNEADIDNARVVWAREMDAASNSRLLHYFNDRGVWLLSIDNDADPPHLAPYDPLHPAKEAFTVRPQAMT